MRWRRLLLPLSVITGFQFLARYLSRRDPDRFDPVVQCGQGHRYRSIWVPGGSLKGLRWFGRRYQWCPVGHHWSWTRRVDAARLSADELSSANAVHDLRVA
jgi:hypothetical protein